MSGLKQTIQLASLAEHRCFRRVQIFGCAFANDASAKTNAFAFHISNREHDAVAKTVITFFFALFGRALDDQSGLDQQGVLVIRKHAGEAAPTVRRVAQPEIFGDLAGEPATFQIGHGFGAGFELFAVSLCGFLQHIAERGLPLPLLGCALTLHRIGVVFRHLQAIRLRQILHRIHKRHAGVFHQKTNRIAIFSATKAMEKLLAGTDRERGGFLTVEWTQPHVIGAAFFQLDIATHHFHHIAACNQLLDERLWNGHGFSRR